MSGSAEGGRIDGDPGVLGGGDHATVGVVERGRGEQLAAVAAAEVTHDDVLLADDGKRVDAGGHPAEHGRVGGQVGSPAARAVERRPGDGERGATVVVVVLVPVLGGARVGRSTP